jgi:hypothetical protein
MIAPVMAFSPLVATSHFPLATAARLHAQLKKCAALQMIGTPNTRRPGVHAQALSSPRGQAVPNRRHRLTVCCPQIRSHTTLEGFDAQGGSQSLHRHLRHFHCRCNTCLVTL